MLSDQLLRERNGTEKQPQRPGHERWHSARPHRCSRFLLLLLLAMFGLHLLTVGQGATSGTMPLVQSVAMGHVAVHTGHASHQAVGLGAGAATDGKTGTNAPALCINPLDVTCWLQSAAQWVAQQVVNALQPVIDAILNSPLNILTQTPPADTYQNPTLITWFAAFLTVVDLALASLIVITSTTTSVGLCSPANMVPSFAQTVCRSSCTDSVAVCDFESRYCHAQLALMPYIAGSGKIPARYSSDL